MCPQVPKLESEEIPSTPESILLTEGSYVKTIKIEALENLIPANWQAYMLSKNDSSVQALVTLEMIKQLTNDECVSAYDLGDFIQIETEGFLYNLYDILEKGAVQNEYFMLEIQKAQNFMEANIDPRNPNFTVDKINPDIADNVNAMKEYISSLVMKVAESNHSYCGDLGTIEGIISRMGGYKDPLDLKYSE
jgi:hypothetical protein